MEGPSRYVISAVFLSTNISRISITVNLRQAIKAEDERQVTVLITNVDVKTIAATAKELTGEEATILLEKLSKLVTLDPRRLSFVVEWTREIILAHAPYLSSQTRTKLRLKPILDILNQRTSQHSELVRMKKITDAIIRNATDSSTTSVVTPTNASYTVDGEDSLLRWSP